MQRSEIWYSDGSLILQVENTQFRVHWSVLALNSSFFRNLQGLPQPPDQPRVEGCPIIELHDSLEDVEYLLKALYNPMLWNKQHGFQLESPYIASFIRLGLKYDFQDLFDIASEGWLLRILRRSWNTMLQWRRSQIEHYPGVYHDMLTLARENDLWVLLPCAYYRVAAKFSLTGIFKGASRSDETVSVLSSMDQHVCALGRERLLKAQWQTGNTLGWLAPWKSTDGCTDERTCLGWREAIMADLCFHQLFMHLLRYPMSKISSARLCKASGTSDEAGRTKMWEALPSFFDLPPWSELKNSSELSLAHGYVRASTYIYLIRHESVPSAISNSCAPSFPMNVLVARIK
ncbi:hypothetical protein B0H13DRAFT_2557495 [Mycena leptocephala]|nr:hypothetical protein B0H13DRAFT_2557495 [Mycena leptocephala]